jgi:hypothetical protein
MYAHMQQEVVPPRMYRPNLPWYLSDVIVRALSKAPSDRFASARELYDALGASPSSATTVAIRVSNVSNGYTAHHAHHDNTIDSVDDDESTRTVAPPEAVQQQTGWLARWLPQVRLSSKRFGGAQDAAVMYQAAVGAGFFGGAIRIVAVRMGSAGRQAADRVTHAFLGAGHLLTRRPFVIGVLALVLVLGGRWWWQERRATAREIVTSSEHAVLYGSAPSATHAPSPSPVPVQDSQARVATTTTVTAPLTHPASPSLQHSRSAPQNIVSAAMPAGTVTVAEPAKVHEEMPTAPVPTPPVVSPTPSATPPAPAATLPTPTATVTTWSKTFEFPVFRGTHILHVAPDRIRYEMRDTGGRVADDAFTVSCADIAEWTPGRFKGSLHVQLKAGKKLDFSVSGQKLTEILDSYAEACGH